MGLIKASEQLMTMDDSVWKRHANPWSVWTRVLTTTPLFFAFWSIHLIDWFSLIPIGAVCLWIWLNPRIFPVPKNTNTWSAAGVQGEQLFLNRHNVRIPRHHLRAAYVLIALSSVSLFASLYGLITEQFYFTFFTFHLAAIFKVWFVDRMAWLWWEMKANQS